MDIDAMGISTHWGCELCAICAWYINATDEMWCNVEYHSVVSWVDDETEY
jgi:hypothetical protein